MGSSEQHYRQGEIRQGDLGLDLMACPVFEVQTMHSEGRSLCGLEFCKLADGEMALELLFKKYFYL